MAVAEHLNEPITEASIKVPKQDLKFAVLVSIGVALPQWTVNKAAACAPSVCGPIDPNRSKTN